MDTGSIRETLKRRPGLQSLIDFSFAFILLQLNRKFETDLSPAPPLSVPQS